jgi:Zn-dependent metalloprotease
MLSTRATASESHLSSDSIEEALMSEQDAMKGQKQTDKVEEKAAPVESAKASNEAFDLLKSASQAGGANAKAEQPSYAADGFIPKFVLDHMSQHVTDKDVRAQMHLSEGRAQQLSQELKQNPDELLQFKNNSGLMPRDGGGKGERYTYDADHKEYNDASLPGKLVRSEGQAPVADSTVNQIYDIGGQFRDFMKDFLHRNSIDDKGMNLVQSAHVGKNWDNAAWDGENNRMVYGEGDGMFFKSFVKTDVIGHEMSHGITQYNANLDYHGQSGALNESFSDCVGIAFKQYLLHEKAERNDKNWLIGEGVFSDFIGAKGLRDMLEPGTAYDAPLIGKDPQPGDMAHYKQMADDEQNDNGGVHINSGIPSKAFVEAAIALGGNTYDQPLTIWYKTNQKLGGDPNGPHTDFKTWANATVATAKELYGDDAAAKVRGAWEGVGVLDKQAKGTAA